MKHFIAVLVLMISTVAFADDFSCKLQINGDQWASEEAPYRGREVRVELGNYRCEAVIDQNLVVTTTVTNIPMMSYGRASGRASATVQRETYNPVTNSVDLVVCKCALN